MTITAEKAKTELKAIPASVTRVTGRPPKGPFRSKEVPGWLYFPILDEVHPDDGCQAEE